MTISPLTAGCAVGLDGAEVACAGYLVYRGFQTEQRDFAAFRRWIIRQAVRRTPGELQDRKSSSPCRLSSRDADHRRRPGFNGDELPAYSSGFEHLLERHRAAERWRSERWDGLKIGALRTGSRSAFFLSV